MMSMTAKSAASVLLASVIVSATEAPASEAVAREAVDVLAGDDLGGRDNGTPGHAAARVWLKQWMSERGIVPAGDNATTYEQAFAGGVNLIGILPARDGSVARPAVILAAHYDGLGSDCDRRSEARSAICNGAVDNAGGVAAVLAAVEALRGTTSAPIAVTLWDREEDGLLGSKHFVQRPTFARDGLRLLINLDIVGLNLFRGFESHHFVIGGETGGVDLGTDLRTALQGSALHANRLSYALGHRRSDMTSFLTAGWRLPFVFLSDGDGSVYHTDADEAEVINITKVAEVGRVIASLAKVAAQRTQPYQWQEPVGLAGNYMPVRSDAVTLAELLSQLEGLAARNGLASDTVATLRQSRTSLEAIGRTGSPILTVDQALAVGRAAQTMLAVSRGLPFIP